MSTPPTKPIASYPVADRGDLPLPPAPGGAGPAAPGPAEVAPPEAPAAEPAQAAVLEFLDPAAVSAEATLRFPFRYEGRPVHSIPVRRLSGAEVGRISVARGKDVELFDFYAAMTGFPKAVLRGLIDDDLEVVLEKADPFLCPFAREYLLSPTGGSGAPSSAVPAGLSGSPGPAP